MTNPTRTHQEPPTLVAARQRFTDLQEAMRTVQRTAVNEHRDLTDAELHQVREYGAQARELGEDIQHQEEEHERWKKTAALAGQLLTNDRHDPEPLGSQHVRREPADSGLAPRLVPDRQVAAQLCRAAREGQTVRYTVGEGFTGQERAAITLADTGLPAKSLDSRPDVTVRRLAEAARLVTQTVNGTPDVAYPVFGAGAADVVAEGAAKPEYAAITPGSAQPQMIAVWTDFTRQAGLTQPNFDSLLQNKLARLVAKREDKLLVSTVTATAGIQTVDDSASTGTAPADTLLTAASMVLDSDVSAAPDFAIISSADVVRIFGSGASGQYGETPAEQLRLQLHGMTCYVSPAVAAGSAIVGAWNASSRLIVGQPPSVLIDTVSGLKTNTVTLLLEEAVALAVDEPTGFVSATFAA